MKKSISSVVLTALWVACAAAAHAQDGPDTVLRWKSDAQYWFARSEAAEKDVVRWRSDAYYWFSRCEKAERDLMVAREDLILRTRQIVSAKTALSNVREDLRQMNPGSLVPRDVLLVQIENVCVLLGW